MNARIRAPRTAAEAAYAAQFAEAAPWLPGAVVVAAQRRAAMARFEAAGLPHARMEGWKYTDLKRLVRDAKPLAAPGAAVGATILAGLGSRRLAIVDGRFRPDLSDLEGMAPGLAVRSVADALAADEPLLAAGADDAVALLNAAFAADGLDLSIAGEVERPIHLAFATSAGAPRAAYTRSRVRLGEGARATLIETHEGPDDADYHTNAALDLTLAEGARLDHSRVQREGAASLHLSTLTARLAAGATLRQFALDLGAGVSRAQISVDIAGPGAAFDLSKASLLAGRAHADTTLALRHAAAGSRSRELVKAVVDGEARAVFQGRISVAQAAQRTDARMMARALLLSDEARADCKPELEIFADDVQCGHGAAIGGLDSELKFYLMARGLPEPQAEALLIEAFATEALDAVAHQDLRDALAELMSGWLAARR